MVIQLGLWSMFALESTIVFAASQVDRGPKIADLRHPLGTVSVVRDGESLSARQVGRRVVNGDLYDSDSIHTGDTSSCDLVFADDSRVSLQGGTQILVEQRRLREASESGKTIGRRIRIIAGHVTSDIVPSPDIQTEFHSPAGTLAIRGTLVDIEVNGPLVDIEVEIGQGDFVVAGGQCTLPLHAGADLQVQVDVAGGIDLRNLGPDPLVGHLGEVDMRIGRDGHLRVSAGDEGYTVEQADGEVALLGEDGAWNEVAEGETCPYSDEPVVTDTDRMEDPSDGGAVPPPDDGAVPIESSQGEFLAGPIATSLATEARFALIDDFDRPDGPVVGSNLFSGSPWAEFGEWVISGGSARASVPPGPTVVIATNTGHFNTFNISVTFRVNDINLEPFLEVNALSNGTNGMRVMFDVSFPNLYVSGPAGGGFSTAPFNAPIGQFYTVGLKYDGTTLCGQVESGGASYTHCISSPNATGEYVAVGANNLGGSPAAVLEVGEIRQE